MKTITDYEIFQARSASSLVTQMSDAVKRGWEPIGQPFMLYESINNANLVSPAGGQCDPFIAQAAIRRRSSSGE